MTNSRYLNASKSYSAYLTKCFANGFTGNPTPVRFDDIPADGQLYRDAIAVGQDLKKAMDSYGSKKRKLEK